MKLETEHIDHIKSTFMQMHTRDDLLSVLNYAKPFIYGEKTVPFELRQLTWYSNPKLGHKRYSEFKIKKKSGSERTILAPARGLKAIQKTLSLVLQCVFEPHSAATGFVKGKSIVDNAKVHQGNNYVYNIDLKDFFPSIDQARVWSCLKLKPFNLYNSLNEDKIEVDINSLKFGFLIKEKQIENAKETNLYIKYEDILYSSGRYALRLKAGGAIYFKVKTDRLNPLNGLVKVNISKSNLAPIKDAILKGKEENYKIPNDEIVYYILLIIRNYFNKKNSKNTRGNLADLIKSLTCTEIEVERKNNVGNWEIVKRDVLPQGAPTSPVLSNVVCQRLDFLLTAVANRFGLRYTRYADDITFSSMHNVYQKNSKFLIELKRIISEQGFHIKESKTRLQKTGYRKEVTGLVVNDKVNVKQRYIKQLRMWLYYWERYGYNRASEFFVKQYNVDRGHVKKGKPNMINVIGGKLDYLKMVKGEQNESYFKLKERFDKLSFQQSFINKVLYVWEEKGIESAMDLYYLKSNSNSQNNH